MAVCSLQAVFAGSGRYDKSAYLRLTRLPTDSLLRRGTAYLSADNCEDSAMVCFRLVADRLEHENDLAPEGLRQYAKALNSIGYLYVTYYSDMEKAYRQFARSMEVARRGNLPDLLPRAYLNIGALYNFNNKYVTDGQYKSFIMDNLRRAFREAIGMKQWDVVVYSMFNMASMEKDSIRMVASDIRTFQHLDIPDTIPLLGYTRSMIRGLQAFHQGRYEEAMAAYREMLALTDQPIPNRERMELMARSEMADLLVVMGKGREAIDCLHTIIGKAASYDADDILIDAYETLSDLYLGMGDTQRADSCNYEYLKLKDAFVSRSNLQKVDRSRFLKQIEEVSAQVESERADRLRVLRLLAIVVAVAVLSAVALFLILKSYLRQKRYIRTLFEKNEELLRTEQTLREQNKQLASGKEEAGGTMARGGEGAEILRGDEGTEVRGDENGNRGFSRSEECGAWSENSSEPEANLTPHSTLLTPRKTPSHPRTPAPSKNAPSPPRASEAPKHHPLSEEAKDLLLARVKEALADTSLICQDGFTQAMLAEHIGTNANYLSVVINEKTGKNFRTLVNECRVKEVCRRLSDQARYGGFTIETIAQGVGFKSYANFVTTFRNFTGISPSAYLKMARQRDKKRPEEA